MYTANAELDVGCDIQLPPQPDRGAPRRAQLQGTAGSVPHHDALSSHLSAGVEPHTESSGPKTYAAGD